MKKLFQGIIRLLIVTALLSPLSSMAQSADAIAAFNTGTKSANAGKYDDAIVSFNVAIGLYPAYTYAYNWRGFCYQETKDYDRAVDDLKEAIKLDKAYVNAYYNLGISYYSKKNYPEAIVSFNEAIKLSPDSNSYNRRGNTYYSMEEYDIAINDYKAAIRLGPKFYVAYANMGNAYSFKKDYDNALKYYTESARVNPQYALAFQEMGNIYMRKKDYEAAIMSFNELVRIDPRDMTGYSSRARVYRLQNNSEKVISEYSRFLKLVPNNIDALVARVTAYSSNKQYDLALADYSEILKLDPKYAASLRSRADVYRELGQKELAIKDFDQIIELAPTASNYRSRGLFYEKIKENDLALKDLEESIKLTPNEIVGYLVRAGYYRRKHQYDLAIIDLEKAFSINPKSSSIPSVKFYVEKERGNYQAAIALNEQRISLGVKSSVATTNFVAPYMRLGQVEKAIGYAKQIDTTTTYAPGFYKYYYEAIFTDLSDNQFIGALEKINTGLRLYKDADKEADNEIEYLDMLALKGYLLEKLDQNNEAKQIYEQALLLNPLQGDLKIALENLQKKGKVIASTDKIPPIILLISPVASRGLQVVSAGTRTEVIGKAKDPSGILSVKVNGIVVSKIEDDGLFVLSLALKPGINNLIITATDKKGNIATKTFPVTVAVASSAVIAQKKEEAIIMPVATAKQPQFHAILIAENDYEDSKIPDLENPVRDAEELAGILKNNYTFDAKNIETLYNKSREEIMQALVAKSSLMTDNDNLVIFYAGHGIAEKDKFGDIDGYWVPSSAKKGLNASYISADDINKALKRSDAKHILVIADACFSGAFTRSLDNASVGVQKQYSVPSRKIMASGNMEPVPDNSKFVYYLKKNLKENKTKYLTAKKLFDSFYEAILNNSDTSPQYAAIKNVGDEGGEFVFILK